MADRFRVGDRVRIINAGYYQQFVGKNGTITQPRSGRNCWQDAYGLEIDGIRSHSENGEWSAYEYQLAPIYDGNDPATLTAADDWWVKRWVTA